MNFKIEELKFNADGLIPAVVQDVKTKDVLMVAYMNAESIKTTLETGFATYWSRSRGALWKKGATSGNVQKVKSIAYDCDKDALLVMVDQVGVACHTGSWSCFEGVEKSGSLLDQLADTIAKRKAEPKEGSYTTYLFNEGIDKILKKVGEESAEIIIAAKNPGNEELVYEISDLVYHTLVLMAEKGVSTDDIKAALKGRMAGKY
ncbi:MAG: bifunctional phosphoribosyl-AMP cyclohydrolase/phosphoribosyl-ATP diphosphatase HisIE [Defluviitaleaceae bacterium]|nr:bifunctional phosphoribosyl-AMP cyclohydrolase/phosphoribosyl-ATP diphosphatase HisIE [Defluviitaleaceae bacterium]